MKNLLLASFAFGACCQAFGQSAPPARTFEVASIKVRHGAPQWKFAISGPRLTLESYTLFGLIKEAYNLQKYQIQQAGAPAILLSNDTLYDVTAKAEGDAIPTRDEFRQMLQSLLADRFRLTIHREPKEMPVYALVVGKNGPRFHASAPDADPSWHFGFTGANKEYTLATMPNTTMKGLAESLGVIEGRPVLDQTGLTGTWDIKLFHTPDYKTRSDPELDSAEISIFTAVQEQLGLRLDAQKGTVEVLTVDHAEKPSEN